MYNAVLLNFLFIKK